MKLISFAFGACASILFTNVSQADPREDFDRCLKSQLDNAMRSKPSLVEFTATLDKACSSDALVHKDDETFSPTGNAAIDSVSEKTRISLQKLGERYANDSKGSAVAYYSKVQEIWRKTGSYDH